MAKYQQYRFVDKTGQCFEAFSNIEDDTDYHKLIACMLMASSEGEKTFEVGDMMCFRDELQDAGFKWGIDFYAKKVED